MKTQQLQNDLAEWSDATFGISETSHSTLYYLLEEVKELIEEVDKVEILAKFGKVSSQDISLLREEWADVWTLVIDAARKDGLTIDNLNNYGARKLRINKNRSWHKPDENGVCRHVKS